MIPFLTALLLLIAQAAPDPHRPAPVVDTVPPDVPRGLKNGVLIVTKTSGWRHLEHIPHSTEVIGELAREAGQASFHTENAAVFNDRDLARFSVVVLNSTTGDFMSAPQQAAFRRYVERGGGVVALHGAGDGSHVWPWYADTIRGGVGYLGHPGGEDHIQPARVSVEAPDHPVMAGVKLPWTPRDEWYSYARSQRLTGMRVLATIDEASYRPGAKLVMGADHPAIWVNPRTKGRVVYSILGHTPESYDDPNYRRILGNAIRWVARK